MKFTLSLIVMCCMATAAQAKVVTKKIDYKDGDVQLEGVLAYDDAAQGKRPGVLVVHEWWGRNDFADAKAKELAGLGYVAFAVDMYGKGILVDDPKQAGALAGKFKGDEKLIRQRAKAGYDVLASQPNVDPKKIAAIGFCFGGTTVLELAYSGADLAGVVTFHGGLVPPGDDTKHVQAPILVLHGADDPFVPADQVKKFEDGVKAIKADYQIVLFGGAVHSFTNPDVDRHHMDGAAYNAKAATRSWADMQDFFKEIFGKTAATTTTTTKTPDKK